MQNCLEICQPGCGCPEGLVRSAEDKYKCVKREDCDHSDGKEKRSKSSS